MFDPVWSIVFPVLLIAVGVGAMVWHFQTWRTFESSRNELERQFRWRQYRRRMQASGVMGVLGVAVFGGTRLDQLERPSLFVVWWCSVAALVGWLLLIALADALATTIYAGRMRREYDRGRRTLEAELARRAAHANGTGSTPASDADPPRSD